MEMLRALLEMHPQAAAIADIHGTWVIANRAFGRLFGLSTDVQTLPSAWREHFSVPLRSHDASLWNGLLTERHTKDLWFVKPKQDGTRTRFLAHGKLLDRKSDGNSLIGWTFFEAGPCPDTAPQSSVELPQRPQESDATQPHARVRTEPSKRGTEKAPQDCRHCVDKSREALRLLMLHTNEQKRDMEKRIAENYLLTIVPLIDHLKSMNLPPSQAYLIETLEFNLKHINSVFHIKVRASTKRLSSREGEICQMIRAGKNSQQIAHALDLKVQTVMVHRKHIRRKLGLRRGGVRLSTYLQSNMEPLF
jgi:PAS domain S-box-containing protein